MNTKQIIAIAAVAIIVIAGVSAFIVMDKGNDSTPRLNIETELAVFGNANNDYDIDSEDRVIIQAEIPDVGILNSSKPRKTR